MAGERRRLNANTLLAEDVKHELRGAVVLVDRLAVLGHLHVLQVLLEEVRAVHGAALGLGVELGREDRTGLVDHAFVATVVEVDKVLLELAREGAGVNSVTVVLAGDVALASGQVERWDVVCAVAVLQLDSAGTNGESEKLVAKTDTHDRDGRFFHQCSKVVDSFLAMGGVTGAVGDEHAIVVLSNLLNRVVVREDRHGGATAGEAAKDILLHTAIEKSDVKLSAWGLNDERGLGANTLDEVDLTRVDVTFIFVGVIFITDGNPSEGRTLLSEVGNDGTGINTGDGRDALASAPFTETLDGSPVAVVECDIGDDNSGTLNVWGLKVLEEVELVTFVRGHTVVSNQRLGKDENLAAVRRVGHGLGVANKRGGEDGLAGNVGIGAEGFALEDRTAL